MSTTDQGRERGQLLVVFALTLVGLIGAVGLVIDGGSTFVQKRDEQNVADAAAMAAGYAHVMGGNPTTSALSVSSANGYTFGSDGVDIAVSSTASTVTVTISKPHHNYFAGLLGLSTWDVSATATAEFGAPNGVYGAMPLIFNEDAFNNPAFRTAPGGEFGEPVSGSEDVPQDASQFNWTVYCESSLDCNADSATVDSIVGLGGYDATIFLTDSIAPLNAGAHTTLFDALADEVGNSWPVGIVSDDGTLIGWAWFHLTGAVGGSTKEVAGWFDTEVHQEAFRIGPSGGTPLLINGQYIVHLIN
ncbi:MAG TPA: pilus assembly protein TadG-related protein [Candidatus Polarisedimenticolia bacterium]|nr:pilus assembly protein TadG-related protein [Candidatus Polarisedimenticolia bacterium]